MKTRRALVLAAALLALAPAASHAAGLPTVTRALSAAGTTDATCAAAPVAGAGLASASYTAPMSGYLTVRLTGAGDWDLLLRNAAGRAERASQGFGASEVVQTWIAAGEKVTAEGCRAPGASRTARLSFSLLDVKPPTGTTTALVRVQAGPALQQRLARSGFDLEESHGADWADIVVDARQLSRLRALGLDPVVRQADLSALDDRILRSPRAAAASPLPSGRTTYRTYEDIQAELKKLVKDHPGTVRPVILGKTYQGREIAGVEIAKNVASTTDGRPTFFVMGVHHAREWPAAEISMEWATFLAQGGPEVTRVLARERNLIVPVVNVDGYISARNSPSAADTILNSPIGDPTGDGTITTGESVAPPGGVGAYRRKNCNNEDGNTALPCEMAHGVDNNRNYGNLWGGPGSSADFTSQSYHGQGPRSEQETKAVFNYVRSHHVTTLISLHTIAALVLRPPGLSGSGKAPDEKAMKKLGDAMAAATGYTSQFGWQLYDTAGTTEDDSYAATGGYGYTIELGPSGGIFHGPYETHVIKQWTGDAAAKADGGMRKALLEAAAVAMAPSSHARLTGTAPAGSVLRLKKSFVTDTSKYCLQGVDPAVSTAATPYTECTSPILDPIKLQDSVDFQTTVPKSGRFDWHIGQSTRPFVNGGAEKDTEEDVKPPIATFNGAPNAPTSTVDHEFTLPADLGADKIRVDLNIAAGEDYDLELFRKDGDTLTPAGTSGNAPGENESILVAEPVAGAKYVARVTYYAAATGQYTLDVTRIHVASTFTTGSKEAYTLTCESPAGKVFETYRFVIDRGQRVSLRLGCGKGPSTDASGKPLAKSLTCSLPNTAPTIGCQRIPQTRSVKLVVKLVGKTRVRGRYVLARCRLSAAGTCTLTAKARGKVVGRRTVRFSKAGTKLVRVKLRKRLPRGTRVRVVARGQAG